MKLTYEAILEDPRLLERTLIAARRERAKAIAGLVSGAFRRLFRESTSSGRFARQG